MILLDPSAHPVIGHRGNRAHAPENTLESLQEAVALGVDAVEFDVQVSSDGVLLLMHDLTIDRTTSGGGAVATQTFAALRMHDAGARFTSDHGRTFPWRDRGVVMPTFDEVVEALPRTLPLIVELKTPAASAALAVAITLSFCSAIRSDASGLSAKVAKPQSGVNNTRSLPNNAIACSPLLSTSSSVSTCGCF